MKQMQDTLSGVREEMMGVLEEQATIQHEHLVNNISYSKTLEDITTNLASLTSRMTTIEQAKCYAVPVQQAQATLESTVYNRLQFWTTPGFKYKYCWTHGVCSHDGAACLKPRRKHKKEATFSNPMNRSIRRFNIYQTSE